MFQTKPDTWLIYALGGGWGHLNRALSIARIAAGSHRRVKIISNSPYAEYIASWITPENPYIQMEILPPQLNFTEACSQVQNTLLKADYNCLIVDTFPRGLGGELREILRQLPPIPKVLVHRDLNPNYVSHKKLTEFVCQNYDLVIIPGDGNDLPFAHLPQTLATPPWLMRSHWELDPEKAANYLKLPHNNSKKVILISCSGQPSEIKLFGCLAPTLSKLLPNAIVRSLAPICPPECPEELWVSHFPGIDCLPRTDLVIGGGGYNTVSECVALQVPLLGLAHPRMYDRQARRLQGANYPFHLVTGNLELDIAQITALVRKILPELPFSPPPAYPNGAIAAVNSIEQLQK